jgi:hypothetical protein
MKCAGLCLPGVMACPSPGECGLPPAGPPVEAEPPAPPNADRWLEELHKVRQEMLAYLRTIPPVKDLHWKREASMHRSRLLLAHKLLVELRHGATPEQRDRIDAELARG